jgi:hypothetical protein
MDVRGCASICGDYELPGSTRFVRATELRSSTDDEKAAPESEGGDRVRRQEGR